MKINGNGFHKTSGPPSHVMSCEFSCNHDYDSVSDIRSVHRSRTSIYEVANIQGIVSR